MLKQADNLTVKPFIPSVTLVHQFTNKHRHTQYLPHTHSALFLTALIQPAVKSTDKQKRKRLRQSHIDSGVGWVTGRHAALHYASISYVWTNKSEPPLFDTLYDLPATVSSSVRVYIKLLKTCLGTLPSNTGCSLYQPYKFIHLYSYCNICTRSTSLWWHIKNQTISVDISDSAWSQDFKTWNNNSSVPLCFCPSSAGLQLWPWGCCDINRNDTPWYMPVLTH